MVPDPWCLVSVQVTCVTVFRAFKKKWLPKGVVGFPAGTVRAARPRLPAFSCAPRLPAAAAPRLRPGDGLREGSGPRVLLVATKISSQSFFPENVSACDLDT